MAASDQRNSVSILDGLNGLGCTEGHPPHSAFRLVGPGWVSPSASQSSSVQSEDLRAVSSSASQSSESDASPSSRDADSHDDSPVPRFIQPAKEQRLNEDEQGVLSALSLLARTPVKIDDSVPPAQEQGASTPPADYVRQVSEPSASPVRIDTVDFVPPAQGPQDLDEDESVLSELSMQSARQRAMNKRSAEEHYREALSKLADSMMRSEVTRRHVVRQRQNPSEGVRPLHALRGGEDAGEHVG